MKRVAHKNLPSIVIDFYRIYVTEQEFLSARWLSKYMDKTLTVYADSKPHYHILHAYALLPLTQTSDLFKNMTFPQSSYSYLHYLNVQKGVIFPREARAPLNSSEIDFLQSDKIYSNSHSDVYYAP